MRGLALRMLGLLQLNVLGLLSLKDVQRSFAITCIQDIVCEYSMGCCWIVGIMRGFMVEDGKRSTLKRGCIRSLLAYLLICTSQFMHAQMDAHMFHPPSMNYCTVSPTYPPLYMHQSICMGICEPAPALNHRPPATKCRLVAKMQEE